MNDSDWLNSAIITDLTADDFVWGFVTPHAGCSNFVMASGTVHSLSIDIDPVVLETLGNRADGAMMGAFD